MVARRHIDHAGLAGQVGSALGNLAADEGIGTEVDGVLQEVLRTAGAPGNLLQRARQIAHQQRLALQPFAHPGSQRGTVDGRIQHMPADDALSAHHFTAPALHRPAQLQAELHVVAQIRMHVERQVIADEVDVGLQQPRQPLALHAGDARILAFPEIAVMHDQRVGAARHGRIDDVAGGRDGADDA